MPKERSKSDSNFIIDDPIITDDNEHFQNEKYLYHGSIEARRGMGRTQSLGNDINILRTAATRPTKISEETMKEVLKKIWTAIYRFMYLFSFCHLIFGKLSFLWKSLKYDINKFTRKNKSNLNVLNHEIDELKIRFKSKVHLLMFYFKREH